VQWQTLSDPFGYSLLVCLILPSSLQRHQRLTFQIVDGGGIRGLASLYILKQIMAQLEAQLEDVSTPILPCNYFDLIAGTSTGG